MINGTVIGMFPKKGRRKVTLIKNISGPCVRPLYSESFAGQEDTLWTDTSDKAKLVNFVIFVTIEHF